MENLLYESPIFKHNILPTWHFENSPIFSRIFAIALKNRLKPCLIESLWKLRLLQDLRTIVKSNQCLIHKLTTSLAICSRTSTFTTMEATIRIQKNSCTSSPESTFVQVAEASVFWRCDFTGDLVRLLFGVPPTLVMALPNDWLDFALCRECDLSSHTVLTNGGGGC